jgi:hypothetical protein
MFFYVSFLRPPPRICPISKPVTFTPQVANDLRTEYIPFLEFNSAVDNLILFLGSLDFTRRQSTSTISGSLHRLVMETASSLLVN